MKRPPPESTRTRTRVIALGQPAAGDDGVAIRIAEALQQALQTLDLGDAETLVPEVLTTTDPTRLFDWLCYPGPVLIVDAVLATPELMPGCVLELSSADLSAHSSLSVSSHGLSTNQVVELCQTLHPDTASGEIRFLAVSIAPPKEYVRGLSPPVAAAARAAVPRLFEMLALPDAHGLTKLEL